MKRKFLLGVAVLPLLFATSCETGEIETGKVDNITFDVVLGKQTRATEFTNNSWVTGNTVPVEAYATGDAGTTAFKSFSLVRNSSSLWDLTPDDIDQPGYSLTYYAWYPATNVTFGTASTGVNATMAYAVQDDPSVQEDLLATKVSTIESTVNLPFNHILSQVNFAVQGIVNLKINLTDIKLNGVKNAGTYTFGGGWSDASGTKTYTYAAASGLPTTGASGDLIYLGNKGGSTAGDNAKANALMLLPQAFTTAGSGTLTFGYTLSDMGTPAVELASGTAVANLCDFDVNQWLMGKRYLYVIDFTNYFKTGKISFTVDVNNWQDSDSYTVATTLELTSASQASIEGAIATHDAAKGTTTALTVFPISLPAATNLTADIVLDFATTNFAAGDEIRIQCYNTTNAGHIKLSDAMVTAGIWELDNSGAVVTLVRK